MCFLCIFENLRLATKIFENLRLATNIYETHQLQLARIMPDGRTLSEVIADHRVLHVYPAKLMVDVPTGVQSAGELSAALQLHCQHLCQCISRKRHSAAILVESHMRIIVDSIHNVIVILIDSSLASHGTAVIASHARGKRMH
jgi:hypothetical protein